MDNNLKKLLANINENITYLPDILQHIASKMKDYEEVCKKRNDHLLREALGDALTLLSLDEKPSSDVITKCSARITRAIFSNGVNDYHHNGEKDYYNKYINGNKITELSRLKIDDPVIIHASKDASDWTNETLLTRRACGEGTVISIHDSHGLCYGVRHSDGSSSYYNHNELSLIT